MPTVSAGRATGAGYRTPAISAIASELTALKRDPAALAPLDVGAHGLALRLLTPADLGDADLVARLTAWRARWMDRYPTQFVATEQRTARWLRDVVLADEDRLMFLLVDADAPHGPVHGHMGFDHHVPLRRSIELSNVVNGDRQRVGPGAMAAAELRMLAWAHEVLGVEEVRCRIFADNAPSVRLHLRLGFRETHREPLRRHALADGVAYRPVAPGDDAPPDRWWAWFRRPADGA